MYHILKPQAIGSHTQDFPNIAFYSFFFWFLNKKVPFTGCHLSSKAPQSVNRQLT